MRITEHEKNTIVEAVKTADPNAKVWLFGSRADDSKKGGDIDIGILSEKIDVMGEIEIRRTICDEIGEQKIDIVVSKDGQQAFFKHVVMEGIQLQASQMRVDILRDNLGALNLSVNWVQRSYEQTVTIGVKENYTAEEFDKFENLASRYARTTDMLVNKVLRSIDAVEFEDSGTIIDIMNRAEKREIVSSAKILHTIKDLRNNIVHEYKIAEITRFFGNVQEYTPILLDIIKNVNKYCEKHLVE
ncbi:MAG: nucleotidyltransferase domain-containing protein [Treponema sp.]|nr:nucleotidyltransferase domain-containing protein [Treponema sp.]